MISTLIELRGHLIDSLILAKVIDRIQMSGYNYVIADLQVGMRKHDLSVAQIQIWTPDRAELEALLEQLRLHGAYLVANEEAQFALVTEAGCAPAGSYMRHTPAMEVLYKGYWTAVRGSQAVWVVCLHNHNDWELLREDSLKIGDRVLIGQRGLRSSGLA